MFIVLRRISGVFDRRPIGKKSSNKLFASRYCVA